MLRHILAVIVATLSVSASVAQELQPPYERILVPLYISAVVASPLPGAYGSQWTTQFTIRNDSQEAVVVTDLPTGLCTQCPPESPMSTITNPPYAVGNPNGGLFVYVGSPGKGKVGMTLRVQDVSRQAQTWVP